jgi:hypothetical protein
MLFRKGAAKYPVKNEHEGLLIEGRVGRLSGYYEHHTNPTISAWMSKINYYTDRDVERVNLLPYSRVKMIYRIMRIFQRLYFRPGWLCRDGYLGFVVAGLSAGSLFLEDCKVWERSLKVTQ